MDAQGGGAVAAAPSSRVELGDATSRAHAHGLLEAGVLHVSAAVLVPGGVEAPNSATETGADAVACGSVEGLHTVVHGVHLADEAFVDLLVHLLRTVLGERPASDGRDDVTSVVAVDEAGTAHAHGLVLGLGGAALGSRAERLSELALVVVEAARLGVVCASDVNNDVSRVNHGRVARAHNGHVSELREHAQHATGHGLVAVECAVVRAHKG